VICQDWMMWLEVQYGASTFQLGKLETLSPTDVFTEADSQVIIRGKCPLLRGAAIPETPKPFALSFPGPGMRGVRATLHISGAEEISRTEQLWGEAPRAVLGASRPKSLLANK
jgi:hypothetical protein